MSDDYHETQLPPTYENCSLERMLGELVAAKGKELKLECYDWTGRVGDGCFRATNYWRCVCTCPNGQRIHFFHPTVRGAVYAAWCYVVRDKRFFGEGGKA